MNWKPILLLLAVLLIVTLGIGLLQGWFTSSPSHDLPQQEVIPVGAADDATPQTPDRYERPEQASATRREVEAPEPPKGVDASPSDALLLQGIVLDKAERPVPKAAISLLLPWGLTYTSLDLEANKPGKPEQEQMTKADGRFRFRVPRAQAFEMRVKATGYGRVVLRECYGGQDLRIQMEPAGCTIFGSVTWEDTGAPVADVKLRGFRAGGP